MSASLHPDPAAIARTMARADAARDERSGRKSRGRRTLRAAYDAAQTTDDNSRHWQWADSLSADAAARPAVRKALRERARYEAANNSYAAGIIATIANDTIGSGPRLQLSTGDETLDEFLEQRWAEWTRAVRLDQKLRTARAAKVVDGEVFLHAVTNGRLTTPAKLDVVLSECDHFTLPWDAAFDRDTTDGILLDDDGNPLRYTRLRQHPGQTLYGADPFAYDELPAENIVHLYTASRPEQHRGVSELAPTLSLFAELRRYRAAVVAAAETGAELAGVMKTAGPAVNADDEETPEAMEAIPIEKRSLLTLPEGWDISQLKAEQPTTTFDGFVRALLNEIGRCLNMPLNITTANSGGYNYASGKLDSMIWRRTIDIERRLIESVALDKIFAWWLAETALVGLEQVDSELAAAARRGVTPPHSWFWDGFQHADPQKEGLGQQLRLQNNTTTLAAEFAREGVDWQVALRQRARELKLMAELGITPAAPAPAPAASPDPAAAPAAEAEHPQDDPTLE